MRKLLLALVLSVPCAASAADGPVPLRYGLPHQGRVLGERDLPVEGVLNMRFSLYRTPTGGEPAWTEIRNVDVAKGYYHLLLGDPKDTNATALTEDLFEGPLYLGVTIFPAAELAPRLAVGTTPFAVRANLADRIEGGLITDAVITGGSITASELHEVTIKGGALEGVTVDARELRAEKVFIGGEAVFANGVKRTGDTMTGPLAAPSFESTTTTGAPITVASRARVDNLNAELLDGRGVEAFHLKSEFSIDDLASKEDLADADHTNLVNNGSMENWRLGTSVPPSWWDRTGVWNSVQAKFSRATPGWNGDAAFRLADTDKDSKVSVVQTVYPTGSAALADRPFTLSLVHRRAAGSARAEVCLQDTPLSQTCVQLGGGDEWQRATLTHRTTPSPQFLKVTLASAAEAGEQATYDFDALMLVRGPAPVTYRKSPADYTPSGAVMFFPGACPWGWAEYTAARGRTVVATPLGGESQATHGVALTDKGPRTLTDVPSHTHEIDPPETLSAVDPDHVHVIAAPATPTTTNGAHAHTIDAPATASAVSGNHQHWTDPPAANTTVNGEHEHPISTYQDNYNSGGGYAPSWAADHGGYGRTHFTDRAGSHVHAFDTPGSFTDARGDHSHSVDLPAFQSEVRGDHTHTVNIAPFYSAAGGAHDHAVNIPRFTSHPAGSNGVDISMPYVQLTACQAL